MKQKSLAEAAKKRLYPTSFLIRAKARALCALQDRNYDLMAKALHDYTALLPEVPVPLEPPSPPATSTSEAIQAGIFWATAGGIITLSRYLSVVSGGGTNPRIILTGGDAALLGPTVGQGIEVWPEMTLEGLLLAAEKLP